MASLMNDTPFRIVLLGEFAPGHARPALSARRVRRIDRDDVDRTLAALAPEIELALPGRAEAVHVAPRTLEDLHPDRLVETLPVFRALADARARVSSQESFDRAVARIRAEADAAPPAARADEGGAETLGLLERIVDAAAYTPDAGSVVSRDGELEQLIRRLVAPHVVHEPDARQQSVVNAVDAEVRALMRDLLRHPRFRALERAWRAVDFLARRLDTDASLQLHLLDVSREELARDLASAGDDVAASDVGRQLAHAVDGGWAVVVVLEELGDSAEDARVAAGLAALGRTLRAPVVAGAQAALAGAPSFAGDLDADEWRESREPAWEAMRRMPDAPYLGLVAPRFLLRLPYGAQGEPCERLSLEEVEEGSAAAHEDFCWGNGAVVAALLLGEGFAASGWTVAAGHDVGGLPLYVRRIDGEPTLQSCAEGTMHERGALWLLERGIMPLAWLRDSDVVRLVRFQSVSHDGAVLAGRWRDGTSG